MTTTPKEIELHVGHFGNGTGARGLVDEVTEATKITLRVYEILKTSGVPATYYKDTISKSQTENINRLIAHHNADTNGLIVSIHLNASAGTQTGGIGCEVCYTTQKSLAAKLSAAIAQAGGFKDRGAKYRDNIGVLVRTKEPAVLLEPFFVNSKEDVALYNKHFERMCQAIAKTLAEHIGYKLKSATAVEPAVATKEKTLPDEIVKMYYTKKFDRLVVLSASAGIYSDIRLKKEVGRLKRDEKIDIIGIDFDGDYPRFVTKQGFVSANKRFVKAYTVSNDYSVKKGDTLYSIAKAHKTTVAALKTANNLKSDTLAIGQTLKV